MLMPDRQYSAATGYRYGFNGKEKDNEVVQYDYGFRIYDPRLVRFKSVDPLISSYPELTPYQFASNTPIMAIDLDGLELYVVINYYTRDKQLIERSVITLVNKKNVKEKINMQLVTSNNKPAATSDVLIRHVYLNNTEKYVKQDEHRAELNNDEIEALKNGILDPKANSGEAPFNVSIYEGKNLKSTKLDYSDEFEVIEYVKTYKIKPISKLIPEPGHSVSTELAFTYKQNSAILDDADADKKLAELAKILKSDKNLKVTLTGNTDGTYAPGELIDFDDKRNVPYTDMLKARADALADKLQKLGVSKKQITTQAGKQNGAKSTDVQIKNTN